jgi:hypothetical protein
MKPPFWCSATWEGTGLVRWPRNRTERSTQPSPTDFSSAQWLADGTGIVETDVDPRSPGCWVVTGRLWSLTEPRSPRPLPPVVLFDGRRDGAGNRLTAWASHPSIDSATGRAISVTDLHDRVQVLTWNWFKAGVPRPVRSVSVTDGWVLRAPRGLVHFAVELSPRLDRLLWSTMTAEHWGVIDDPQKRSPRHPGRISMLVSDLDGRGMREVASVPIPPGREYWEYEHFGGPVWLPDGRRISYVYRDKLWIAPAG